MEAKEDQGLGLLHQILPPRLEDAGLEDCALPSDSIVAAFKQAAAAIVGDVDDCVGGDPLPEPPGACVAVKGGGVTEESRGGDAAVVGGGEEEERGKDCVDGLKGLEIGDEKKNNNGDEDDDNEEKPILVGGYV